MYQHDFWGAGSKAINEKMKYLGVRRAGRVVEGNSVGVMNIVKRCWLEMEMQCL